MVESAKKFLRKVPIPICGLILGMVSLGNLLYSLGYATIGTIYCTWQSLNDFSYFKNYFYNETCIKHLR